MRYNARAPNSCTSNKKFIALELAVSPKLRMTVNGARAPVETMNNDEMECGYLTTNGRCQMEDRRYGPC